jgi:FKBP-type peptidyl-prolyl cis-trans isomerase
MIKYSLDYSTEGGMPAYLPVAATTSPYDLSEIWTKLKKGDSVIATQMMDTFIARNPQFPAFVNGQYKKGDKITITVKILNVFTSDSLAQADEAAEKKVMEDKEPELVAKFISDNKINATKLPNGVYVEVISPGTGPAIVPGNYVSLNYTGTTFGGKKFDSNTDSTFQHVQPLTFTVGSQEMIKGLSEGVVGLQKDAHVKIYIPSLLGYGAQPNPQSGIKPYESLIFDVVILDIQASLVFTLDAPARDFDLSPRTMGLSLE